ncbi:MAG: hypothetical protein ACK540_08800, partial [Betaproteobacteria bacterium]
MNTPRTTSTRPHALLSAALAASLLTGCESLPLQLTPAPPPPPATDSVVLLLQLPAERALIGGLRLYDEGAFDRAEQALRTALLQG